MCSHILNTRSTLLCIPVIDSDSVSLANESQYMVCVLDLVHNVGTHCR